MLGACAIPLSAGLASAGESDQEGYTYGNGNYGDGGYGGDGDGTPVTDDPEPPEPLERTILVDGIGTPSESHYEFVVDGAVEPSTYRGATIDDETVIDDGHVAGSVIGWRDAFRFSGDVAALSVDGAARVYVDDERVDPVEYGGDESSVLTIVGNGIPSRYTAVSEGTVDVIEGDDAVTASGETATGEIETDVHRLRFSGDLLEFTFDEGGTQVYLDDNRIDPDDYEGDDRLPHVIVFDGSDTSDSTQYSFTVDGSVEQSEYGGATVSADSVIDGNEVRGTVDAGSITAYRFDGEIGAFSLFGEAAVDVEYNV